MSAAQPEALTLFVNSSMELMQLMIFREDLAADPDITPAELADSLKACDEQIERYVRGQVQQVDGIAQYMHECEVRQTTLKQEAKLLSLRADLWERRRAHVEGLVMKVMQSDKATRLEGTAHSFAIKKNPPSVDPAMQLDLIPATYKRVAVTMSQAVYESLLNFLVRSDKGATLLADLMTCERSEPEVSKSKVLAELKEPCPRCGGKGEHPSPAGSPHDKWPCGECGATGKRSVPGARLVTDKVRLEVK